MAASDLLISGGGVTILERLCMGLPGVAVTLAKNQEPSTLALAHAGLTGYAGDIADLSEASLAKDIAALIADVPRRTHMAEAGRLVVDGLGALRVAEILMPTNPKSMLIRSAALHDVGTYFTWANDDAVRIQAIRSEPIEWDAHQAWFTKRLNSDSSFMFVLEAHGLPMAQARFDVDGSHLVLDYSVDARFRGRGLGSLVVQLALELLPKAAPSEVRALVKESNFASLSALEAVGFVRTETRDPETNLVELRRQRATH